MPLKVSHIFVEERTKSWKKDRKDVYCGLKNSISSLERTQQDSTVEIAL